MNNHITINKLLLLFSLSICTLVAKAQVSADLIIRNGKIYDGTGNSWFYGDVAIKDGKILKVGYISTIQAAKIIDAKGLIVAPGFIDVHGHIENGVVRTPTADNYIYDGVTTVITGNCGGSV